MSKDVCSIDSCEKDSWARNWCGTHYQRWRTKGSPMPDVPIFNGERGCVIEECDRNHFAKSYCNPHYWRWRKYDDPQPDVPIMEEYDIGDTVEVDGYLREKMDPDSLFYDMVPKSYNGWVPQHRLIKARDLGRPLESYEEVHHIDGNKLNNDLDNLQLRTRQHGSGIAQVCGDCGSDNIIPTKVKG